MATASDDASVNAVTNTHCTMADRTPMSRTLTARSANSADSCAGRPNSLISVAPGAENRSVIRVLIAALCSAACRCSRASLRPIIRAGSTNTGNSSSVRSVTGPEITSITPSVSASVTRLLTTPESVSLNARCAPSTSLFRRLTSAPVRVRVKNATGIRCTWSNTVVRSCQIRPSPRPADSQRVNRLAPASTSAIAPISSAIPASTPTGARPLIASTASPASSGVATVSTAPTTLATRNHPIRRRCGRANPMIRRTTRPVGCAWRPGCSLTLRRAIHAFMSIVMAPHARY